MPQVVKLLILISFLCFSTQSSPLFAQIKKLSIEYPVILNGELNEWNILYQSDTNFTANGTLHLYKSDQLIDSSLIHTFELKGLVFNNGLSKINLANYWKEIKDRTLKRIIKYTNNLPPGQYILSLQLNEEQYTSYWKVDSLIGSSAKINDMLSEGINTTLKKAKKNKQRFKSIIQSAQKGNINSLRGTQLKDKLDEDLLKKFQKQMPDLRFKPKANGNKKQLSVFYDKTYLGYIEYNLKEEIKSFASGKLNSIKDKANTKAKEELTSYRTLFEQYKEEKIKKSKKDGLEGTISVDSYFDSDQEEYSPNNNIYSEVYGNTKAKILGIPINVEGYFTTQDLDRNIKASYIRVQYDLQSSKDELEENINMFKNDFSSKKSELFSMQSIYGSYLDKLKSNKGQLLSDLKKDLDIEKISSYKWEDIQKNPFLFDKIDTNQLVNMLTQKLEIKFDSNGKANELKSKVTEKKQKVEERVRKIKKTIETLKEIEAKARKYYALIEQTKSTLHFDSAMVMSKIKDKAGMEDLSYNGLLKKSKELLPKNDFTKYTKGLKGLQLGILNSYESDYTLAGQTLKGAGIEYSFGKVDLGISGGRAEYVSRDLTNLDQYNSLLAKVNYEINDKQKIKLIYYTYSPSKNMTGSSFFSNLKQYGSSLLSPRNIGNIIYEGELSQSIIYSFDVAYAFAKNDFGGDTKSTLSQNAMAYKGIVDYNPAKFPLGTTIEYERVGKHFINETLPFIRRNFETRKASVYGDFFKGYLKAKVSYQQLTQNPYEDNLQKNTRWGFDLRTRSKRYPNIQLSYKPFTTFNSVFDTFAVAQRALFGETFTSKASYQLKRKNAKHRWHLLANRNRTNIDTLEYETDVLQAGYTLNTKGDTYMLQFGRMKMPKEFSTANNQDNFFIRTNEQLNILKKIPLQLGQEVAWGKGQINRFGGQIGSSYKLKNKPIAFRLQFRYLYYRNSSNEKKNIYGSMLGVSYDFEVKKK